MKKTVVSVLVVGVLAIATWVAASAYTGYQAKAGIEALTAPAPDSTPLRFSDLKHNQGVFGSSGTVTLHYPDPDAEQQPRADLFQMEIAYAIDHRVTIDSMLRFDWTASLIGQAAQNLAQTFGQNPELSGAGDLDWQGAAQSRYTIPALEATRGDEVLVMSAITGRFKLQQAELWFDLNMPALRITDKEETLSLKQIELALHAQDRFTGEGRSEFRVAEIDFAQGNATGLKIIAINTFSENRIDVSINKSIDQLAIAGTRVSDVELDLIFDDLYAPSVTSLSAVMNTAGNLDNLTPAQQQVVQGALRDLFAYGFSVGVADLSAVTDKGAVSGQAITTIKAASDLNRDQNSPFQFDAAKQLEVIAALNVEGQAVAPEVMALGMMFGVLVPSETGFKSSLLLKEGQLVVNDIVVPFTEELRQINNLITAALRSP
jgi:hypothetical protein